MDYILDETRPIEEEEFIYNIEPLYKRIFDYDGMSFIDHRYIFSSEIEHKIIVYPCSDFPSGYLFDSIIRIASDMFDDGLFFTGTSLYPEKLQDEGKYRNWYIKFSDFSYIEFEDYCIDNNVFLTIQNDIRHPVFRTSSLLASNQLYSPNGIWGIKTFEDHFGVIGGTKEFIKRLRQQVPKLDDQVFDMFHSLQINEPISPWISDLLIHIYGLRKAAYIVERYFSS